MGTVIQMKRTSVAGRTPNTTNVANTSYIGAGELAINLPDGKLFSSNGSTLIEIGTNLSSLTSTTYVRGNELVALGGSGEGGQIVIGYGNNLANSITGQANNTFNIDVIGGNTGSTPLLRIFGQNNDGSTVEIFSAANTGRVHIGGLAENTDSTLKVTGSINVSSQAAFGANLFFANSTVVKLNNNDVLTFNDNTTQNTAFRVYDSTGTRIA